MMVLRRANPHLVPQLIGSLFIWVLIVASVRYATTPHNLTTGSQLTGDNQTSFSLTAHPLNSVKPLSSAPPVATVASTTSLPSDPSGQAIPPGILAPDYTYHNSYARGQCTWYVAGRRPIPPHWGNAVSWYYNAISSGWKVGITPAVGAIAWTSAGYYGHVALVEKVSADNKSVYISEMNYRGIGIKDYRWVSASSFKYIY
ncbi:MAG TPA: CHAP domain-containing protein [Candidatus Saccharimonadia bacterium]|jgi:surface antigen